MTNPRGMNLIVGPQTLATLLKTIIIIKDVHTLALQSIHLSAHDIRT